IAAYSYMALVPVIIPFIAKLLMSEKEFKIHMKKMDKQYPPKHEIKHMKTVKIIFPIVLGVIVSVLVPSSAPLLGMLLFGNLVKEIGSSTSRLADAASGPIMNTATIFLGLTVGATMSANVFLTAQTLGIIVGGLLAFGVSVAGGIFAVKTYNLFSKKKINPLVGATGLSAVPMASRVANEVALRYDKSNHILQYCMASNVSGVIGSAVAAGVLISFLG
ncbi:MAG: sodium ion-translocating decarboxylase subunit beta, partial [Proteiniphilum sp.]|nr:sodium ion-translocating decarboxylase subunit beta [Proteiniphilum sp.]